MIITSYKVSILFILLIGTIKLNGQNKFVVKVHIPETLDSKNFSINYDDGERIKPVTDTFINNTLIFSGLFVSRFATLNISYGVNISVKYSNSYFIDEKPVEFIFLPGNSINDNPFIKCQIKNAFDIYGSEIAKKRALFSKNELGEMNRFWNANGHLIGEQDSIKLLFYKKLNEVTNKDIQFIKNNKDGYFSFWWFKNQIVPNTLITSGDNVEEIRKLLTLFEIFPKVWTNNSEGKGIKNKLLGKINNRKNELATNFISKDINKRTIKLSDLKGKYVLLDFWATWCQPCMKQIPFLKKIRNTYSKDKLVMISISSDVDYKNFINEVNKNKMNWIHIYDSKKLPQTFGVSAYPTLILINKDGVIIHDGKKQTKEDLIRLLDNEFGVDK